jgi:hypothetical protein
MKRSPRGRKSIKNSSSSSDIYTELGKTTDTIKIAALARYYDTLHFYYLESLETALDKGKLTKKEHVFIRKHELTRYFSCFVLLGFESKLQVWILGMLFSILNSLDSLDDTIPDPPLTHFAGINGCISNLRDRKKAAGGLIPLLKTKSSFENLMKTCSQRHAVRT